MEYTIERVTHKDQRDTMKQFINTYHSYITYSDRPSRKLYWMIYEDERLVGIFGLGSCFHRPKVVSTFMEEHNLEFNEVGNNIVFCLANHKGKNVGSRVLSLCRKDAIKWWGERYDDTLKAFQTFILPPRTGAVYRADNWKQLGITSGGQSLITNTIKKKDYEADPERYPNIQIKVFKSGEIKYLLRSYKNTEPKLILMKLNSDKLIHKLLGNSKSLNK
jgi:hypothetical protein